MRPYRPQSSTPVTRLSGSVGRGSGRVIVESTVGQLTDMEEKTPPAGSLRDRMSDFGFEVKKPQGSSKSRPGGVLPKPEKNS